MTTHPTDRTDFCDGGDGGCCPTPPTDPCEAFPAARPSDGPHAAHHPAHHPAPLAPPYVGEDALQPTGLRWRALTRVGAARVSEGPPPRLVAARLRTFGRVRKAAQLLFGLLSWEAGRRMTATEASEGGVRSAAAGESLGEGEPRWVWDEAERLVLAPADPEAMLFAESAWVRRLRTALADEALFLEHALPALYRWAECVQNLPRAPAGLFSEPGGLFRAGLETAVRTVEGLSGELLRPDAPPKEERLYGAKMRLAAFLAGLLTDAPLLADMTLVAHGAEDPAGLFGSAEADLRTLGGFAAGLPFDPTAETLFAFASSHLGEELELLWSRGVLEERVGWAEALEETASAEGAGAVRVREQALCRNRRTEDLRYGRAGVLHLLPMLIPQATVSWLAHGRRAPGLPATGDSGRKLAGATVADAHIWAALQRTLVRSAALSPEGELLARLVDAARIDVFTRRAEAARREGAAAAPVAAWGAVFEGALVRCVAEGSVRLEGKAVGADRADGEDNSESRDGRDGCGAGGARAALLWAEDGLWLPWPEAFGVLAALVANGGGSGPGRAAGARLRESVPDDPALVARILLTEGVARPNALGGALHRMRFPAGFPKAHYGFRASQLETDALLLSGGDALVDLGVAHRVAGAFAGGVGGKRRPEARECVSLRPFGALDGAACAEAKRAAEFRRRFSAPGAETFDPGSPTGAGSAPSVGMPDEAEAPGRLIWRSAPSVANGSGRPNPASEPLRELGRVLARLSHEPDPERFATPYGLFLPETVFPDGTFLRGAAGFARAGLLVRGAAGDGSGAGGGHFLRARVPVPRGEGASGVSGVSGESTELRTGVLLAPEAVRPFVRWSDGGETPVGWPEGGTRIEGEGRNDGRNGGRNAAPAGAVRSEASAQGMVRTQGTQERKRSAGR